MAINLDNKQPYLSTQASRFVMPWPERLRLVINEFAGGNQSEFARRIGVSTQAVGGMLRGSIPAGDTLETMVRVYPEVNCCWLMRGEGPVRRIDDAPDRAFTRGAREAVDRIESVVREMRKRYGGKIPPEIEPDDLSPGAPMPD